MMDFHNCITYLFQKYSSITIFHSKLFYHTKISPKHSLNIWLSFSSSWKLTLINQFLKRWEKVHSELWKWNQFSSFLENPSLYNQKYLLRYIQPLYLYNYNKLNVAPYSQTFGIGRYLWVSDEEVWVVVVWSEFSANNC